MRTYSGLFAVPEFRALFAARVATMVGVSVLSLAIGAVVYAAPWVAPPRRWAPSRSPRSP